jgi:molybdopterin/thiamine biosynthesis adenylyltransferase
MSTASISDFDDDNDVELEPLLVVHAAGFPPPTHPAEADIFARHVAGYAHVQDALSAARVTVAGAGGLASWALSGLARTGIKSFTVADHDVFDRTNASRQLMFGEDIRQPKAFALARNIAPHMVAGGVITAIHLPFADAIERYLIPADLLIVLVDNNRCRSEAVQLGKKRRIPVLFSMLSMDSMRVNTFLQGPGEDDACLWCALPNLDVQSSAPCAAAMIAGCLASAAHVIFFAHRALMGWPPNMKPFNWRATDLTGATPEQIGMVPARRDCDLCCKLR